MTVNAFNVQNIEVKIGRSRLTVHIQCLRILISAIYIKKKWFTLYSHVVCRHKCHLATFPSCICVPFLSDLALKFGVGDALVFLFSDCDNICEPVWRRLCWALNISPWDGTGIMLRSHNLAKSYFGFGFCHREGLIFVSVFSQSSWFLRFVRLGFVRLCRV